MATEKKKVWDIEVPLIGHKIQAFASTQDGLNGRIIKLDLTRFLKGRSIEANLVVSKKENKLVADFTSLKVLPSYILRMMRKNISWVEDSFSCQSKDVKLVIKPFMITKKKVHRSVRKALRNQTKDFLTKFVAEREAERVFEAVLKGSLNKEIMSHLRKVYPLAFFEVRVLKAVK